jgi:uncharacterized protein YjbI with pentapeptide repeats
MDDGTRAALDTEAPVNPYSLLDAVNTAAARSTTGWLLFLGLMAYLLLTVASVTHRDLLLDAGVVLPLLGARIDLARLFVLAPVVFALLHLMLVARFVLLARKALEFDAALRLLESTDRRSHPLRLELDGSVFVQALAGPERSRVVSALLHAIAWATLLVLPLLLLLYMQVAFLPFHNAGVTVVQRVVVIADAVLVLLAGVFLMRAETTFFGAFLRLALNNPGSVAFALAVVAGAVVFSVFAATIPGGDGARGAHAAPMGGAPFGAFARNLDVADAGLAAGPDGARAARPVSLRGRDLRFARLDRAGLRGADLTGANLDGASLKGADLRGARLGCADAGALQRPDGRDKAGCTSARGADFSGARLAEASLAGADLRGARLDDASLEGADLSRGLVAGATFERAKLARADLSGAALEGASFVLANLQGAALTGARLAMADLSGAGLQGADLAMAYLAGAVLREADLEGAELRQTQLYGADLRGARLQGSDLAGALVWRTVPPSGGAVVLADVANIALKLPGRDEVEALRAAVAGAEALPAGERTAGLAGLIKELGADSGWAGSAEGQTWANLLRASEAAMAEGYPARLAEHLGRLACRPRFADSAVAAGVVRRALGPGFKGEPGPLADRLKAADCPAGKAVLPVALLELAAAVEAERGQ